MKRYCKALAALVLTLPIFLFPLASQAQLESNGYRWTATDGISVDTNVTFSVRMTLAGEQTPRDTAFIGQDVSITAIIRPESEDIGQLGDVIIVDYLPGVHLLMRNVDGNFVPLPGGSLRKLVPYLEELTLEEEIEAEVFSGQLGVTGNHRIFIGLMVDDVLYFTPAPLRFDIGEDIRAQAIELFNTEISPDIVHTRCIVCHVSGGQASNQSLHTFVRTSNANHLTINFEEFEELHAAKGTSYILDKVQGFLTHGGGVQLNSGTTDFQNLQEFLELLDQIE